jgi:hypothetical protein
MATSKYFKHNVRSEQSLVESLVVESLQFYGQDLYYLPREIVNKDKVFLDDVPSRFGEAYKIEMYLDGNQFEGEGQLFQKFGIEIRDTATFVVSIKRWKELIGRKLTENNFRPREGDLIYLPMSNSIFEIMKCNNYDPFFQLGQLPTYKLTCELFEYNDEDFDTNIANIDNIEADGAFQYKLTFGGDSASGFIVGETITQAFSTYSMKGEITRWSDSDNVMHVAHAGSKDGTFKEFGTTKLVTGATSNKSATPTLVQELQKIQNDAQNKIFDDFESDFLDFSESNPFGDMQ